MKNEKKGGSVHNNNQNSLIKNPSFSNSLKLFEPQTSNFERE